MGRIIVESICYMLAVVVLAVEGQGGGMRKRKRFQLYLVPGTAHVARAKDSFPFYWKTKRGTDCESSSFWVCWLVAWTRSGPSSVLKEGKDPSYKCEMPRILEPISLYQYSQ